MDTIPLRSSFMEKIGKRLRELRNERFWSRAELAERAGVSPVTIGTLEDGDHPAQRRTIRKIAAALGVEPHDLIERD